MRKKAEWTAEMRAQAGARGVQGWVARTPESQQEVRELLARHRGRQSNKSKRARAAQARRAKDAFYAPMTSDKARWLTEAGMLKREPVTTPEIPARTVQGGKVAQGPYRINGIEVPESFPRREHYADDVAWKVAIKQWHSDQYQKELRELA